MAGVEGKAACGSTHPGIRWPELGIRHVASWLPGIRMDTREKMDRFAVNEDFLRTRTGMLGLARLEAGRECSDMAVSAFQSLQAESGLDLAQVDCLLVCTQNPDVYGLPHTSAIVHGKLGLPEQCACFDLSLGCSGYVYGLTVIQGFMLANGFRNGVLITADPYSRIIDEADKNTSLLFGDGATATWLGPQPVWQLGRAVLGTRGDRGAAIRTRREDRRFEMAGRAVVEFCSAVIPKNIDQTLQANGLNLADLDRILAHQGSRYIVELISRKMQLAPEKVPFECAEYGNTVSSSIPMLLCKERGDRCVLLTGFGVGLSWGSIVLYRRKTDAAN